MPSNVVAAGSRTSSLAAARGPTKEVTIGVGIPLTGPGAATGITTQRTLERGTDQRRRHQISLTGIH
jgi:hypothetical protein